MCPANTSAAPDVRENRATRLRRQALERRWRQDRDADKAEQTTKVRTHIERGRPKKRRRGLDAPAPKQLRRSLEQTKKPIAPVASGKRRVFRRPDKPIPKFADDDAVPVVDIEPVGGVMHGVQVQYLKGILDNEEVDSTYARTGELIPAETDKSSNKRKKDQIRGGSSAVFTRAFGREQYDFRAAGYGVGASEMPKPGQWAGALRAQLIVSGEVLQREGVRAGTIDYHGGIHGASDKYLNNTRGDFDKVYGAWGMQSRRGYNQNIKNTVTGKAQTHNEQLHYLTMPLKGALRGILCTSKEAFDETIASCGGTVNTDPNVPYAGTVKMGGVDIPVVLAKGDQSMVKQLQAARIADENGRVR